MDKIGENNGKVREKAEEAGLAMAFKLLTMAEKRWRKINSAHLTPLVITGAEFPDGKTRILPDLLTKQSVSNALVEATFN